MILQHIQKKKHTISVMLLLLFVCVACGESTVDLNSATPTSQPTVTTGATITIIDKSTSISAIQSVPEPTSKPISTLAVFNIGTTRSGEDKLDPANITNVFTQEEAIFVFAQYGGAKSGIDTLELGITVNNAPSQGKIFPLEQKDGILIVPLSKIIANPGIGKYVLEIRFQNMTVLTKFEFQVMPRPLTSVSGVAQVSPSRVNQTQEVVPVTPTRVLLPLPPTPRPVVPATPTPKPPVVLPPTPTPSCDCICRKEEKCNSGVVPPTSTPAAPHPTITAVVPPTSTPAAPPTATPNEGVKKP
jgi:hypothetical protein